MINALDHASQAPATSACRERWLLIFAMLFVAANGLALMLVRGDTWTSLWPLGVWAICAISIHFALGITLPHRDPFILPVVMLLAGWGLTLVARLAPAFITRQTAWLLISTIAAGAVTVLPPQLRILQRYRYTWLIAGLLLLGATLIFGVNPSGDENAPRLWLGLGEIYFQPSEALKLLLLIFLASYLADKRDLLVTTHLKIGLWKIPSPSYIGPMLLMWGFCVVLLVWQRDLGAASLFFLVFLAMLYVSTEDSTYPLIGLILLFAAGIIGYHLFAVVRLRVDMWWNPWIDPDDRGFQIVRSLLSFAAGGIFGQGVGQGLPTSIPVVHSDFVFAAIAEEWGLLGAIGALLCIALLVMRSLRIAVESERRPFRSLLAAGIGMLIAIQSLLIMAGVLKLIPLTGVTLPFVSYGGSSLLSSFIMVGLLLRLSDPGSRMSSGWLGDWRLLRRSKHDERSI
jgi:cell division protein FtsW (lipid II flippase)